MCHVWRHRYRCTLLLVDNLELQWHQVRCIQAGSLRICTMGRGRGLSGPRSPTNVWKRFGFETFFKLPRFTIEKTNKNQKDGHIFRPKAAHLRTGWSKSGLKGLSHVSEDSSLSWGPTLVLGTFSGRRVPAPGMREFNASIETASPDLRGSIIFAGPKWLISCLTWCILGLRGPIRTWEAHSRSEMDHLRYETFHSRPERLA